MVMIEFNVWVPKFNGNFKFYVLPGHGGLVVNDVTMHKELGCVAMVTHLFVHDTDNGEHPVEGGDHREVDEEHHGPTVLL